MKEICMIAGLVASLAALQQCGVVRQELRPEEYVSWVEAEENGLRRAKTINGYTFDLQYKPAEYVVLRENGESCTSGAVMAAESDAISGMQYFTLRISKEDGLDLLSDDVGSADQFSSRLVYFTSAMQKDIFLVDGGDTLPCSLFHFERTYSVDPRSTFLLGFMNAKVNGQSASGKTFVFEDRELGTGPILLSIDQDHLDRIPILKLD